MKRRPWYLVTGLVGGILVGMAIGPVTDVVAFAATIGLFAFLGLVCGLLFDMRGV